MLPGVFSLLVAIAGWYYLVHAGATLQGVELEPVNRLRTLLRRIGGLMMLLLAVCFYALFYTVDQQRATPAFYAVSIAVMVLLAAIVFLGVLDLRLTLRLRRQRNNPPQ